MRAATIPEPQTNNIADLFDLSAPTPTSHTPQNNATLQTANNDWGGGWDDFGSTPAQQQPMAQVPQQPAPVMQQAPQ